GSKTIDISLIRDDMNLVSRIIGQAAVMGPRVAESVARRGEHVDASTHIEPSGDEFLYKRAKRLTIAKRNVDMLMDQVKPWVQASMRNELNALRGEAAELSSRQPSIFPAPTISLFREETVEDEEIANFWSHEPATREKGKRKIDE
ncbi:hypothetical protein HAX54_012273, partial [Datura stramonium]|nr:hypothetical protein [Datura stramonium]